MKLFMAVCFSYMEESRVGVCSHAGSHTQVPTHGESQNLRSLQCLPSRGLDETNTKEGEGGDAARGCFARKVGVAPGRSAAGWGRR